MTKRSLFDRTRRSPQLPLWLLFPLFFAAIDLSHWTLLRLPYFWDEGGYYIPAALDFFQTGTLIPQTTVTNAHPPLPSLLLAGWWHVAGFAVINTRVLICMVAAAALLGLYRLARGIAGDAVASVTTLLTALYPVWFAQSTLAHADIFAAAFTLWGLSFYLPHLGAPERSRQRDRQRDILAATVMFSFATLSKETAIMTPLALAAWEAVRYLRDRSNGAAFQWFAALAAPVLPLIGWYAYHFHKTGFVFGNPEFLRYNATGNMDAHRIALCLYHRLLHLTAHMNMFVPVGCTLAVLLIPALRPRLPRPLLTALSIVIGINWIEFSVLGGALLTRYLLPVYPLLLLLCVVEWHRRTKHWLWLAALSAIAFLCGLWISPPYAFAPEDNLTYRDMIVLHQHAISFLEQHYPEATVLTAWPATSELARPEIGYTHRAFKVDAIQNFSLEQMGKAAADPVGYDTAFIFSTKWEPLAGQPNLGRRNEPTDARYFDFHHDLRPSEAAALLHGEIVWQARKRWRVGRNPALPARRRRQARPCRSAADEPRHRRLIIKPVPTFASLRPILRSIALSLLLASCAHMHITAQSAAAQTRETGGRLVLVLPFDNRSGQPNLSWIGDSFPDTLNQRLNSAGFLTITRDDRLYALDHLGLPADFKPTRATTIRMAQTLDADYIVVGSYTVNNNRITVQAQTLSVNHLRMSSPLEDSSPLDHLFDLENGIAWKVAHQIDPQFKVAQQTFLSASAGIKLSAFENYIRGSDTTNPQEREKRLQQAIVDTPGYAAALLAMGKTQYTQREYDQAAVTLGKVPAGDRLALEANFYLGLARFNAAKYSAAETAFGFVASRLPLPEVVNNQAVAASRQNKDAVALFQRASTADPSDADYHFNLAVAYITRGDAPNAIREIESALKLHATDSEATELRNRLTAAKGASGPALKSAITAGGFDPVVRIRRSYSEASFRQAAFQMDQMRAVRLASLPAAEQSTQYVKLGHDYLAQGLIPEAEQQFQAALAADRSSAAAHAGLAEIRERSGNPTDARTEAQSSIQRQPNVAAYLVLARLELQASNLPASASDVGNALRLEPTNSAALGMKQALSTRGQSLP